MKKIKGIKYLDVIAGLLMAFFTWFVFHITTLFPGKPICRSLRWVGSAATSS